MICTCIQGKSFEEILDILQDPFVEMAEIRLDRCSLTKAKIDELFSECEKPLIATCRASELKAKYGEKAQDEALKRLRTAIEAGAAFADLEIEAPVAASKAFRKMCEDYDTRIIRSWHDFNGTPDADYLMQVVERCYRYGADVAKVVTTCGTQADAKRVESLYRGVMSNGCAVEASRLVAFGMGDAGRNSRLDCLKLGAPYTYAALTEEEAVAPGQWGLEEMHKAVYGNKPSYFRNNLEMPCAKSFAQRAIIAAALAEGTSRLRGYTPCDDSEAAIKVAKALGAKVVRRGTTLSVTGTAGNVAPAGELHVGESGLLARLMIPVVAAAGQGECTVTGEKTLLERPLPGARGMMAAYGVVLKGDHIPVRVCGKLIPGTAEVSGRGGSQLISGLLMALPLCSKPSVLYVTDPKSIPYMFITVDVLRRFGVRIDCEMEGDAARLERQDWSGCTGITFRIRGRQRYKAADFDLERDWSAAAPFLVAGAVFGAAELVGMDVHSLQADLTILDAVVEAGAGVSTLEEDGLVSVRKAPLEPFEFDLNNAPDLFPSVAVLAAFCPGESRIAGVGRLAGKESNRAEAIKTMLLKMGVPVRLEGDEMVIAGKSLAERNLSGCRLRGGSFTSSHDHRMVMALTVAALGADSEIKMDDTACVAKSYPGFFEDFV